MEMEKRINSQEKEEDVIDLMEIARLLLHKWKLLFIALLAGAVVGGAYCAFLLETTQHTAQKPVFTLQAMSRSCLSQICS